MLALCSTSILTKHAYLCFAAHSAMVERERKTLLSKMYCSEVSLQFMGNCMMACAWWTLVWIVIMIMFLFFSFHDEVLLNVSDVSWHIRDKLWPMPKHSSINLYVHGNQKIVRTDSPGQPPRLSHSSWTGFFHSITTCWPLCLFILNNFTVDMNYKQLMLLVGV